ncbi:MAG TPA: Hpt domain-containing protein, partial [Fibrobacteraceae bacterium]|nr:Hpt domain-containing protein [Fibrobacteraceae bacterium]
MERLRPGDLTTLTDLFPRLDDVSNLPGAPSALQQQCARVRKMVETAILSDGSMDGLIIKLNDVLGKMLKAVEQLPTAAPGKTEPDAPPQATSDEEAPLELDLDLINKFIANQRLQLEDFEAYVLEIEKGNQAAREEVRRYLHTLKGEFGVLGLADYSLLLHHIEDSFLSNKLGMDPMLRFKDWMISVFPALSAGKPQPVTENEYQLLGIPKESEQPNEESQSNSPAIKITPVEDSPIRILPHLDASFYTDFVTEAHEHIHTLETRLLDLETEPTQEEPLNAVFRACHTIKGLAGFLELSEIQKLSHAMESLMDKARNRQLILTPAHTDLLLTCSDCLKELVSRVEAALRSEHLPLPAALNTLLQRLHQDPTNESTAPITAPPQAKLGEILVQADLVPATKVDEALKKQQGGDPRKVGEILMTDEGVSPRSLGQALGAQVQAKQQAQLQGVEESVRVPVGRLDQLIDAIGEAVIAQSMIV